MQIYDAHGYRRSIPICGLYYNVPTLNSVRKTYLPQVDVKVHASILATTSRTALQQTFINPSTARGIKEVRYAFPLYDGVSVVGFSCQVGDRLIVGEVKERDRAKEVYNDAVARGETAGLLEQLPDASDVFTTAIGNIPPSAKVVINVTYLGELKHDMEVDGIRFTFPTSICPRYGHIQGAHLNPPQQMDGTFSITVDAEMPEGSFIQRIQSPSHPIAMSMGTTSVNPNGAPSMSRASATLSLGVSHLDTDFVVQVVAQDTGVPKALLETHPNLLNHRALMATLVPKFALTPEKPEVVFVCDQSGSMRGPNIMLAKEALQIFLKSLPVGVKFNVCSFGSSYSFLFPRSAPYGHDTLTEAVNYAQELESNYGGTEMLRPIQATIENRYNDMPLEIVLLTDGGIWNQQALFDYLNEQIQERQAPIRVFTLGIGSGVSHSLIEGVAKASNGFSQTVQKGEKMNSKVVRMLKGALSPHINDYTLKVKYSTSEANDDFEIVEKVADSLKVQLDLKDQDSTADTIQKPISLYDTNADPDQDAAPLGLTGEERYAHLPPIPAPKIIQAPQAIPALFAFNRTTIYLLLGPDAPRAPPTSVVLRGTSAQGPLELEIPVQVVEAPGETIHQLAAKKAVSELEQGRGWLASASDADGQLLNKRFDGRFSEMVEREAVRLGVQFQVGGKWCSFVATENKSTPSSTDDEQMEGEWEIPEDEQLEGTEPKSRDHDSAQVNIQQQQLQQMLLQQQARQQQQQQRQQHRQQRQTFAMPRQQTSRAAPPPMIGGGGTERMARRRGASTASASYDGSFGGSRGFAARKTVGSQRRSLAASGEARFITPQAGPQAALLKSAGSRDLPAPENALRDYQSGIMVLEQQNRNRLNMTRVAAQAPSPAPKRRRRAAGGYDTLAVNKDADPSPVVDLDSNDYTPSCATDSPTSPHIDLPSPSFSPTSPTYSPTSPNFGPESPRSGTMEAVGPVSPKSPAYTPTSPCSTTSPTTPTQALTDLESVARHAPQEVMHLLITHQTFSGEFAYTPTLLSWLNVKHVDFNSTLRYLFADLTKLSEEKAYDLLATALGVIFLERRVGEDKGEWELVVEKARTWVGSEVMGVEEVLWREAEKLVVR